MYSYSSLGMAILACVAAPQLHATPLPLSELSSAPTSTLAYAAHDAGDLVGGLIKAGSTSIQIDEIVWGINDNGFLNIAYLSGMNLEGQHVVLDNAHMIASSFIGLESIEGVMTMQAGTPILATEIVFGINTAGYVVTAGMEGMTLDGFVINTLPSQSFATTGGATVPACACRWEVECAAGTCDQATACDGKPGTDGCKCTTMGKACGTQSICKCPADGWCPDPDKPKCEVNPDSPGSCKCQKVKDEEEEEEEEKPKEGEELVGGGN